MTRADLIDSFALFIATEEGFFKPDSIAKRHHNPGNLTSWGKWPVRDGYVEFHGDVDGWNALKLQLGKNIFVRQLTFRTFFAGQRDVNGNVIPHGYPGYCPAPVAGDPMTRGNDPETYARKAVEWVNHKLGAAASPDTVIESLVE